MNQYLQSILELLNRGENLTVEQKTAIADALKAADKEFELTAFKLDRTEKVKRTTAILLEETIEELEQKRKAIEAQNRELQIEASLERVRSTAMSMHSSEELGKVVSVVLKNLHDLGFVAENGAAAHLIIFNSGTKDFVQWSADPFLDKPVRARIPYAALTILSDFFEEKEKGLKFFTKVYPRKQKDEFFEYAFEHSDLKQLPEELKQLILASETYTHWMAIEENSAISVNSMTGGQLSDHQIDILKRFARVFEQAYIRFLDLQKAEAQSREAQIEAALERVRSSSMAMHTSDELQNVIRVLTDQLTVLGFEFHTANFITNASMPDWEIWISSPGSNIPPKLFVPYFNHRLFNERNDAVTSGKEMLAVVLTPEEKSSFLNYFFEHSQAKNTEEDRIKWVLDQPGMALTTVVTKSFSLSVINYFGKLYTESENEVIKRLAHVFEQSYTRFLDLQKAEAQAREAQIELALERVRARAMAMQNSEELKELIGTVFTELTKLDLVLTRCVIMIYDAKDNSSRWWMANSEDPNNPAGFFIKQHEHPPTVAYFKAWRERKLKFTYALQGKVKQDWDAFLFNETELKNLPGFVIEGMKAPDLVYLNASFNNFGNLTLASLEPLSDEHFDILLRFAKVFDLTYTRFNDLQKAEVQAREAKIEASLERIRGKAMAMHRSEEIDEVLEVLFDQFDVLGIIPMSTHLTLIDVESNTFTFRETGKGGRKSFGEQKVSIDSMDIWKEAADKWKAMEPLSLNKLHFPKESLPLVWQVFHESFASMPEGHKITPEDYPDGIYHTAGNCKFGYIGMNQVRPATEEEEQIVLKFAVEFGRLYQRYLDLQKAETQTKEAKIEAALERVRSSSLAMHKSEELKNVVKVVFENLESLGIKNINSVNINILHPGTKVFDLWLAAPGQDYTRNFKLPYFDHPIANDFFEAVKNGETLHRKIYGYEVKNKYFGYMFEHSDNKHLPEERKKLILAGPAYAVSAAITKYSSIFIHNYSGIPFSDEENNILLRFARVFDQTYTRFLDLQKVEAQTREAMIEASLERVRGKAMAMHSSKDLAETIAAFYNELESFSITPRRCGVGLLNKETRIAELSTMNSTGDGNSIEIIGTLKMEGHPVLEGVYENWLLKKEYHPVLRGAEIPAYYRLVRPQIPFPDYPNDAIQYGYFFFFPEGGVYAWTEKQMEEEELVIYRRFTSVLSLTYKRYKDLQQAEELARQATEDLINLKIEKKRTEEALTELRNTQSQLVQAEKMASLGELTAGIAHEIQNPLNFVNNFSEVSRELLEEMNEQLAMGNKEEATEIGEDIKQNLQKILHHGKRADSIVKGMLQHSRSSSGQKELTDINMLADEYLRLAFHGLRAKDKSFNADLKTEFDETLEKIDIVPQEIGRVLVNLLNNAFYTVNEKRKKEVNGYVPIVILSTRKKGGRIEVAVKDNGNGIPKESLEKIFQPFFTTKPTGQGTGLGLSLSYDIIKAHGGDIKVETKPGEGSSFIIQLPAPGN